MGKGFSQTYGRSDDLYEFNPDNINQAHMDKLALCLINYMEFLDRYVVLDDDLEKKVGENVEEGKKRVKKLIDKLRDGKTGVFIDMDE